MSKFKVGDQVCIVNCDRYSSIRAGDIRFVSSTQQNPDGVWLERKSGGSTLFFHDREIELHSKTPNPKTENAQDDTDLWEHFGKQWDRQWELMHSKKCNHSWKQYLGFNDSFEYCEHCDARKDEL